jgi:hypothetical protein
MRTFDFARLCEGPTRPARPFRALSSPRVAARALLAVVLVAASAAASAVPSFARQTGQPCMTCHVGGFGPQLTDFGITFKLNGYTLTKGGDTPIPLAGMVMTGFTHTKASQDPAALDGRGLTGSALKSNDNLTLDQVSLFYAGRIAEHLGIFSQLTYDGLAQHTSIDNVDVRAADTAMLGGGHSLLYGASVNNSPGVQDPFNTMPAWAFPYIGSNVAPGPGAGTVLDEAFGQKATGVVAYGMLDNTWYGELGTYRMQSVSTQKFFGIGPDDRDAGALRSPLYARFAMRQSWGAQSLNAGLVMFNTGYQPDRTQPDVAHVRDVGVDASWRYLIPQDDDQVTVLGNVIHESQGGTPGLTEYNLTGSWYHDGSYGFTAQRFGVNAPGMGSRGTRLQFDWTPFGARAPSDWLPPNLRLGVQLTAFDRLDGQRGSAASDADSVFLFAWLAF